MRKEDVPMKEAPVTKKELQEFYEAYIQQLNTFTEHVTKELEEFHTLVKKLKTMVAKPLLPEEASGLRGRTNKSKM